MKECWVCAKSIDIHSEEALLDWYLLQSQDVELDSGYQVRYFCCFSCLEEWVKYGDD